MPIDFESFADTIGTEDAPMLTKSSTVTVLIVVIVVIMMAIYVPIKAGNTINLLKFLFFTATSILAVLAYHKTSIEQSLKKDIRSDVIRGAGSIGDVPIEVPDFTPKPPVEALNPPETILETPKRVEAPEPVESPETLEVPKRVEVPERFETQETPKRVEVPEPQQVERKKGGAIFTIRPRQRNRV